LAGADLNILNKFDLSPLYLALLNIKTIGYDCAEFLIEENA
jgi:ankyrin repeat protein